MTREEIRRENARALAADNGGLTEFGRALGMEAPQVSQIIGKTPHKNIGNSIARRIEKAYSKPEGWIDIQHSLEPATPKGPRLAVNNTDPGTILKKLAAARELHVVDEAEAEILANYRMASEVGKDYIRTMAKIAEVDPSFIVHHQSKS